MKTIRRKIIRNIALTTFLFTFLINGINIISNDTYNSDLIYGDINTAPKITNFKEKYHKQFIKLFQENCENIYIGANSQEFLEHLLKNKDQNIWGYNHKNKLQIKSCVIEKKLAGFICYTQQDSNFANKQTYIINNKSHLPKVGYIALLCVSKNHRQQKIGTSLILAASKELFLEEKVKYITILTDLDNKPARNMYEKIGFTKIDEDKSTNTIFYRLENNT